MVPVHPPHTGSVLQSKSVERMLSKWHSSRSPRAVPPNPISNKVPQKTSSRRGKATSDTTQAITMKRKINIY